MREIELTALLKYFFNRRNTRESFLQVASGPNSTNIHFGATSRSMAPGDMIVFSDISCPIPARGRFSKEQREIYELVLKAQEKKAVVGL